jgi:homoserine kinase
MKLRALAPATVANLGPGFDCLALALDLWNEFVVDTDVAPGVEVEGEGRDELARPATNLLVRTVGTVAADAGVRAPAFALRSLNRVPLGRGLGSSATAVSAGVLLAEAMLGLHLDDDDRLGLAAEIEGHPDNVAACLLGGLALVHRDEGAPKPRAIRLEPDPSLRPVVLVAETERVSTAEARGVLPADVPLATAVTAASRAALAVIALTERPDLLAAALADVLHEPFRLPLAPKAAALHGLLRSLGYTVCLAGSGPSLLVFEPPDRPVPDPGSDWRILRPALAAQGAHLTPG